MNISAMNNMYVPVPNFLNCSLLSGLLTYRYLQLRRGWQRYSSVWRPATLTQSRKRNGLSSWLIDWFVLTWYWSRFIDSSTFCPFLHESSQVKNAVNFQKHTESVDVLLKYFSCFFSTGPRSFLNCCSFLRTAPALCGLYIHSGV